MAQGFETTPLMLRWPACLLHASFRPRLAATLLRFAITSPPSGYEEDFHLQAVEHARSTTGERHCCSQWRSWLRGVDLNHRPLGYEPKLLVISTTYKTRVAFEKPCK